jgi:hypothetical protein
MSSPPNKKLPETDTANTLKTGIPTEFFLSLAAGPMLLGVLSAGAVFSWLQAAGVASEEVFRGDRLPVLNFPNSGREE